MSRYERSRIVAIFFYISFYTCCRPFHFSFFFLNSHDIQRIDFINIWIGIHERGPSNRANTKSLQISSTAITPPKILPEKKKRYTKPIANTDPPNIEHEINPWNACFPNPLCTAYLNGKSRPQPFPLQNLVRLRDVSSSLRRSCILARGRKQSRKLRSSKRPVNREDQTQRAKTCKTRRIGERLGVGG